MASRSRRAEATSRAAGESVTGAIVGRRVTRYGAGAACAVLVALSLLGAFKIAAGVLVFLFGAAMFATIPPLQVQAMTAAADAPVLASAFNIAAFNLANAAGAWLGGVALDHGIDIARLPLVAAAVTLIGLVLTLGLGIGRPATTAPEAAE